MDRGRCTICTVSQEYWCPAATHALPASSVTSTDSALKTCQQIPHANKREAPLSHRTFFRRGPEQLRFEIDLPTGYDVRLALTAWAKGAFEVLHELPRQPGDA